MLKRILFAIIILLILGYFGISYFFSTLIVTPNRKGPFTELQSQMMEGKGFDQHPILKHYSPPESINITSFDGIDLSTWYFKKDSSTCAIVFTHGWGANRFGMFKYLPAFESCGCDLVFFDHRGHYKSGEALGTGGVYESRDLLSVTVWLQDKTGFSNDQIGWVGASWGAATALTAGASEKDVAFILADSPFESWETAITERAIKRYGQWTLLLLPMVDQFVRLRTGVAISDASALENAKDIEEPVLLIHSKTDASTSSEQSAHISANLKPENSVFHHTDWGAGHTRDFSEHPEKAKALVEAFLRDKVDGWGFCFEESNQLDL